MGIVVIGATFVDIKGFPNDVYIPEGRNAGTIEYIHGGVSRNVVENIANVGLKPTFISIVDNSALGIDVLNRLKEHHVNINYVQKITNGMGTWLAVFDQNGDVAGSISQRPNLMPILDLLEEKGDEIISQCDSIVLEADINIEIVEKVFKLAHKYNKKVFSIISNMSIALKRKELLKQFDCFICNELEAGMLFDDDYSLMAPEELKDIIIEKVRNESIPAMIVTMGKKGSIYADINGNSGVNQAKKVEVKETTGAGDAFCSGVAIGLTYGKTLEESVKIGTLFASKVIVTNENVCSVFSLEEYGIDCNKMVK